MYDTCELTVSELGYSYGQEPIINDLSFVCRNRDTLHIVGPNGAGKTTLMKLLLGILTPLSGTILYNGKDTRQAAALFKQSILYFSYELALKMTLSPMENLSFFYPQQTAQRLLEVCEQLGLTAFQDTPVMYLSAGQQRRVHLARLLLAQEPLWFLDEPLTALDQVGGTWLKTICEAHHQRGGVLIVTSHQALPWDLPMIRMELNNESA